LLTAGDAYIFGLVILVLAEMVLIIKKIPLNKNLLFVIFIIYCTLVVSVTLFPIPYQEKGYDIAYNFKPFSSITNFLRAGISYTMRNIVGNIILSLPLGILLPLISKKKSFSNIFVLSVIFAICIELLQLKINLLIGYRYRSVDVDDVILNTLGAIIGCGIYKLAPEKLKRLFE